MATTGEGIHLPTLPACFGSQASPFRNEGGLARGKAYLSVRGEILRPLKDELQRRHFPRIPSSIKNQSVEIEDD